MNGLYMDKGVIVTGMENGQVTELKVDGFGGVFTLKAEEVDCEDITEFYTSDVELQVAVSETGPDDIGIDSPSVGGLREEVGEDCEGNMLYMGDYVVGIYDNGYGITNEDMLLGEIVKEDLTDEDEICVRVIAHVDDEGIGQDFDVLPHKFRKATTKEIEKYSK